MKHIRPNGLQLPRHDQFEMVCSQLLGLLVERLNFARVHRRTPSPMIAGSSVAMKTAKAPARGSERRFPTKVIGARTGALQQLLPFVTELAVPTHHRWSGNEPLTSRCEPRATLRSKKPLRPFVARLRSAGRRKPSRTEQRPGWRLYKLAQALRHPFRTPSSFPRSRAGSCRRSRRRPPADGLLHAAEPKRAETDDLRTAGSLLRRPAVVLLWCLW